MARYMIVRNDAEPVEVFDDLRSALGGLRSLVSGLCHFGAEIDSVTWDEQEYWLAWPGCQTMRCTKYAVSIASSPV